MRTKRFIANMLVATMLVSQFGLVGAALAEDASPSPSPTPVVSESPEPSPSATPTPSPSAQPSPSASPSASPSSSPSAEPSPSATPAKKKPDSSYSKPGVNGCVGIVPKWVFDTVSGTWASADQGSFTCDTKSGYYLSPKYVYDKQSGWYKILAPNTPLGENMITAPNVVKTVLGDLVVGSKDYQVAQALGLLNDNGGITLSGKAAQGSSGTGTDASLTNSNQTWMDLTNLVNVINVLSSNAGSGDVTANKNTEVGGMSSGTASVIANLINLLASAWSWSNGNLNFFSQTFKDWNGDIMLAPGAASGGSGSLGDTNTSIDNNTTLDVKAQNTGNIVNNVDLNAQSGDVAAHKNTGVGNVASGSAMAEVNIINLINSFINSGSSFFGILNFVGNFNGDILFPNGFLNGLVSGGASGPGSSATANVNNNTAVQAQNADYKSVDNNINTTAGSGSATVDANSSVGNVSTGDATTQNSLFNLANSTVFGDNAVLVIVNVLGHWVGKIMTLPGGSTQSALLTGNAQVSANSTAPGQNTQATVNNNQTADTNSTSVGTITNNVDVNAQSGDVSATKNTGVGNVSTGDAKASSNVANLFNSAINVKHWFGVLVINVLGDWVGSVNEDTAAGEAATSTLANQATAAQKATPSTLPKVGLLALVGAGGTAGNMTNAVAGTGAQVTPDNAKVLTAAANQSVPAKVASQAQNRDMSLLFAISAVIMLIAGALATIDSKLKRSQK
jgi:hypothetical protein